MTTIKAAVLRLPGDRFSVETLELDAPGQGEIVVRIAGAGLCHTDLSVREQILPFQFPAILGHEGAGVVQAVGPGVTKVKAGDRVVLSFAFCGHCRNCRDEAQAYCSKLPFLNLSGQRPAGGGSGYVDVAGAPVFGNFFGQSSFASHSLVSESNIVKLPDDVPVELMGPLGCGIQTGTGAVLNVLRPQAGSTIAVFGVGAVGLAAVMAARIVGCSTIIAIDLLQSRLDLALELGATHALRADTEGLDRSIGAIVKGGLHYSVDCTGRPEVLRRAVDVLAPRGVCALVGLGRAKDEVSLNMSTLLNGRMVRGVMEGDSVPEVFIPQLIGLWREGQLPFDKFVRYYKLEQINEAVADSLKGDTLKAILCPAA